MSEQDVASLYDALHAFESRRRQGRAYPVHKTLLGNDFGDQDIYDWISDRLDSAGVRHVLDAGCGVGYGSICLARRFGCTVTGLTMSERELANARSVARQLGLDDRLKFRVASFDDLPGASYDVVIAVESLKHSMDLKRSLGSIIGSLMPQGRLVIVDDLYDGQRRADDLERQLTADWELERLYTEADFLAALGADRCSVVDLSDGVRRRGAFTLAVRLLGIELSLPFVETSMARALRAFRGGLTLEKLYAGGAMSYRAIFFSKAGGASS